MTGGAVRLGRELALGLAAEGYDIALHYYRSAKEAQQTAKVIGKLEVNVSLHALDLMHPASAGKLVDAAIKEHPGLELLVNSASIFDPGTYLETDEDLFNRHFALNFRAPFFLTQRFAQKAKQAKHVVNILDTAIQRNSQHRFAYLLSKKAFKDFTEMAAIALGPNIRVNGIAPGTVLPQPEDVPTREKLAKLPLKKDCGPEDILKALHYLVDAEGITGQILFVDGGRHLL